MQNVVMALYQSPFVAIVLALVLALASLVSARQTQVHIVNIHPHDPTAFTEGFFVLNGSLVESTGLAGRSFIRQYRLPDATIAIEAVNTANAIDTSDADNSDEDDGSDTSASTVEKEFQFSPEIFGEGIACIGDKLYALTYKKQKILVLSRDSFKLLESHPFETTTGEGWGMTTDGHHLIVSDGSATVAFHDPTQDFQRVRSITVTRDGQPVRNVNELEYVDGQLLANVWFTNDVLRIDARTGTVLETIDLAWMSRMVPNVAMLTNPQLRNDAVMNGIAFDPKTRHVFLTGKLWDSIFEVRFSSLSGRDKDSQTSRG
ncbi:hypothetical protein PINS_up000239 [Pythium insidiosum]|nr:hypothetical protein PINS_up000239 [Pythium insidiosum]